MVPTQKIGALVVGGEHPGLGIVRSLGRRGIPVYVLDDQHSVSEFSRYTTRVVKVKDLRDERKTVDAVLRTGRRFNLRNWILFPTRDETVAAFSHHRAELAEFFKVPTPDWKTVQWAWDKKKTYDLAERLKIPCPHTFHPRSADELPDLYSKLPLAIKPAIKENFFYATGAKAWRADTPEKLQRMYAKAKLQIRPEEILVQEIIPGNGQRQVSYCAFFRDGKAHGILLARRQRQHPREFGRAATYVETIELPAIEELAERFLRAINYYGLVEIEFKQDPRDGEYKLLDVNARTWGFHILGSRVGVDFPYLQFADQLGRPVTECRGRAGVGWLRWMTDLPAALSEILAGEISVTSYIRSLRTTGIESVFCWQDPLPAIAEVALLPYLIATKYFHSERNNSVVVTTEAAPPRDEPRLFPAAANVTRSTHRACYEINPLVDSRWPGLVENHPRSSVFHTRAWLETLGRTYQYEPIAYSTCPPGQALQNAVVFCRISSWLTGQRLVSLPFSDHCEPLWDNTELASVCDLLKQKVSRREVDYMELRPIRAIQDCLLLSKSTRSYCFHELDLRPDLDILFNKCHKDSTQRKIRRAAREHLNYDIGQSESLLDSFFKLYLLTRRRHKAPPQPIEWFHNLIRCFGDHLHIRVASKDNYPVAAMITLRHKDTLVYKYGCSDPNFHNLGATQMLFWKAIEEAKHGGLCSFDLGRSECDNVGLMTFKDRWGATRSTLTYSRFATSAQSARHYRSNAGLTESLAKRFVCHLPDRVFASVGDLLYKHIG